ncbi:hypothetical protein [Aquimarina sp. 2201CG14-23]|uniref:hypothetical protein n=1 Tax=Aquimarina mycalae TaxID=3040073 RepID=UPI002477E10B|nr:hypothetical protein [Aquimarina sp. 2201CG14-23]MDH7446567.1 hypothetical protein [Aquimarina sp. 2201CG14-23]
MKYLKKIIVGLVLLELLNLVVGFVSNGVDAVLPITGFNDPPLYYDMENSYGVTRQKNTKQIVNYSWGGILYHTNSLGFRDQEFTDDGTLITGNSFVEGFGVDAEDRFSEVLEKNNNITINNAGSGGVWTPIQSVVLLRELLKNKKMNFSRNVIILTPGEVVNIDKRSPDNDKERNYPYRKGDTIVFHKAAYSSFTGKLSLKDKVKRFSKSLLISKIYTTFKYYGTAKVKTKVVDFDKSKLDWLIDQIDKENFDTVIDIIVINNLGRIQVNRIEEYTNTSSRINFKVINFPDELSNYFVANGHLNAKGNRVLANLLTPILLESK